MIDRPADDMMTEMMNNAQVHVIVEGRVQGVGFRYFVLDKANQLHLTGWVRNRFNGEVEVTAEGRRQDLDQLLNHLRTGPRSAFVSNLIVNWREPTNEYSHFTVRSSA